jgi:hypothetical protein
LARVAEVARSARRPRTIMPKLNPSPCRDETAAYLSCHNTLVRVGGVELPVTGRWFP